MPCPRCRAAGTFASKLLCLALSTTLPGRAAAQPAAAPEPGQAFALIDRIEQAEAEHGEGSAALIEPLSSLASDLSASGDTASAAILIERARQLVRENFGPHSLRQDPFYRRLIEHEEAAGDHRTAWVLENELLDLALRRPANPGSVPILEAIGDRRMAVLFDYLGGEMPPQIVIGCYYNWAIEPGSFAECSSGSRSDAVRALVSDIQRILASAINVILENEDYTHEALHSLEAKLLGNSYRFPRELRGHSASTPYALSAVRWQRRIASLYELADWEFPDSYFESSLAQAQPVRRERDPGKWHHRDDPYQIGRLSLQRRLAYAIESAAPLADQAELLVRIADWDLLHGRNGLALDGYRLAHASLEPLATDPDLVEALFAPEVPVLLPAFTPSPLTTTATAAAGDYVDLRFELSRYGRARKLEIVTSSPGFLPGGTDSASDEIAALFRDARFRPRFEDGRIAHASQALARYMVAEGG